MRHRQPAQALAWVLAALAVLLLVPTLVLLGLNVSHVDAGRMFAVVMLALAAVAYAGAGRVITDRLPGNAIGWLLSLVGLSVVTATFTEQYALYGLVTARGSVPGTGAAAALAAVTASLTIALLFPLILLFPDGRLPSRRWRPVLWAMIVVVVGWVSQWFQAGTMITGGLTNALDADHWRVRRAGAAGHRGAAAPQRGRGRGVHAGRRRAVHPAAVQGAAAGGPTVQPDPV